jgi:hypothetical protein
MALFPPGGKVFLVSTKGKAQSVTGGFADGKRL